MFEHQLDCFAATFFALAWCSMHRQPDALTKQELAFSACMPPVYVNIQHIRRSPAVLCAGVHDGPTVAAAATVIQQPVPVMHVDALGGPPAFKKLYWKQDRSVVLQGTPPCSLWLH